MTETNSHNQHVDRTAVDDAELLITRIIDSEVDADDRARFERMAKNDPGLWRKLAERQQDMLDLSHDVESELAEAFRMNIDLARRMDSSGQSSSGRSPQRPLWWLGWAAAVALAAAWIIIASVAPGPGDADRVTTTPALGTADRLTPEQLLHRYLDSPFVVGELDPIMLQHEEVAGGRIELRILRRIEEAYMLDADEPLPIDADGRLIRDPAELRRRAVDVN